MSLSKIFRLFSQSFKNVKSVVSLQIAQKQAEGQKWSVGLSLLTLGLNHLNKKQLEAEKKVKKY